jgi:ubiquinone/menaquinone biosynthesis C-methylase UbiE
VLVRGFSLFAVSMALACRPAGQDPVAMMLDPARSQLLQPPSLIRELGLAPDSVVADIGAGAGFLTLPLARAVPRGSVIATDVVPEFVEVTARRAREAGLSNVTVKLTGREDPELEPGSIDLALLCQVDHFLPDRVRFLRVLTRALAAEGRIAIVNFERHRADLLSAARTASLAVEKEWRPSPPMVLTVLRPKRPDQEARKAER